MLSEHLARNPSALEGLLEPEENVDARRTLRTHINGATRLRSIQIVRRAVKEREFCCRSQRSKDGWTPTHRAGSWTALAEAAVSLLVPRVLTDFSTRFGRVPRRLACGGCDGEGGRAGDDGWVRSRPDVHL